MWGHRGVEAARAARRVSKDQLQSNGKGMSLSPGYCMRLLALIRTNLRVGCHFILFRNIVCMHFVGIYFNTPTRDRVIVQLIE